MCSIIREVYLYLIIFNKDYVHIPLITSLCNIYISTSCSDKVKFIIIRGAGCGLGNAACPCRDKQCNLGTLTMKPPSNVKTFEHPQLLQTFHLKLKMDTNLWSVTGCGDEIKMSAE